MLLKEDFIWIIMLRSSKLCLPQQIIIFKIHGIKPLIQKKVSFTNLILALKNIPTWISLQLNKKIKHPPLQEAITSIKPRSKLRRTWMISILKKDSKEPSIIFMKILSIYRIERQVWDRIIPIIRFHISKWIRQLINFTFKSIKNNQI